MQVSLKAKLVAGFVAVIALTGATAALVSLHLVGEGILREVQNRVSLDLNSAGAIVDERLARVRSSLELTALREFTIRDALARRERRLLSQGMSDAVRAGDLDFAGVVDEGGTLVARHGDDGSREGPKRDDPMIQRALRDGVSVAAPAALSAAHLARESTALADRACIPTVATRDGHGPAAPAVEAGLVLMAVAPVVSEGGELLGAVYGGVLVNGNTDIVDTVKNTLYRGERYRGRDLGAATMSLGDVRVSTNVLARDGERALGTRLSPEVGERVLRQGERWTSRASVLGEWYFTAYEPLRDMGGAIIGSLAVGVIEEKYAALHRATLWYLVAVALGGMVGATIVGYLLALAIVRPLERLARGAAVFAAGDYGHRVQVDSRDELGTLGRAFNALAEDLEKTYERLQGRVESADNELKEAYAELRERQSQLIHAEKLASVGALAAGVAHEINNPLGTINMYAQLALDELPADATGCRESIDVITKHATRAGQIVKNLLAFARRSELKRVPVAVGALVNDVLGVTEHQARLQGVEIVRRLDGDVPDVSGDADKLRQVLVNVIVNALHAMPDGGALTVAASGEPGGAGARIVVSDTGAGIAQEDLGRIFDPFFTTKETGKGTGLGLSVSQGIVEQHDGTIRAESSPGTGTTFTIVLPAETKGDAR